VAILAIAVAASVGVALARSGGETNRSAQGKVISGTARADHLVGTRHRDRIDGHGGGDRINGRGAPDNLFGGSGADRIRARDGRQDMIDCGPGKDVAIVDRIENGVYDCEHLRLPKPGQRGAK
jgi:hemolysin type calcium-binding protein